MSSRLGPAIPRALLFLLLSAVAPGCSGGAEEGVRQEVEKKVEKEVEKKAETKRPEPAAATAPTPSKQGPHDPVKGEPLYALYCASCHGARGAGDGPVAQALVPKPANHGDGNYMNPLSNDHLFKVIKEGGLAVGKSPLMAPWGGSLSEEQTWDVVAFVRSLADPPYTGPKP